MIAFSRVATEYEKHYSLQLPDLADLLSNFFVSPVDENPLFDSIHSSSPC